MKRLIVFLFPVLFGGMAVYDKQPQKKQDPPFLAAPDRWVDSVFNSLNPEQRLGQLFMIAAYSNKDLKHVKETRELIENFNIGGLIWMQGGPVRQGKLANYYQSVARTPLLYSMDAEWGLAMRLDSTPRYPRQMTMGAIADDSLIYLMGRQAARDCKRLGVHVSFSPVVDVNNNPLNPVIGMRSFGEDEYKVAQKSFMYMKGLQDEGVMANGKHFPGHGDTDADSHEALPVIKHNRKRLDSLELYPFQYLFDRGLASVMVAHLSIPALDSAKDVPSTLSSKIVSGLLKKEMGFKGLIFTDALNMKGVAAFVPGLVEVKALAAGNDVMLFSADVAKAIAEIKKAVSRGTLLQADLDEKVKKILKAKYWCGLHQKQEVVTRNLSQEIISRSSEDINDRLASGAITLLKNEKKFLPLRGLDSTRILEVSVGSEEETVLFHQLRNFGYVEHAGISHTASPQSLNLLFEKIKECDLIILQLNKSNLKPENNFGVSQRSLQLMDSIAGLKPTALVLFCNPYLMNKMISFNRYKSVIIAFENIPALQKAAANAIAGLSLVNGKLPVTTNFFPGQSGLIMQPLPIAAGMLEEKYSEKRFSQVDSLALAGITEKAYPGCQVIALKDGKTVYQRSFGRFTYASDAREVSNGTLYDLASVTKIAGSSLALMKLRSEGKFDYKQTLGFYLPELAGTDKADLVIEDVLSHQAGLQAWIPFFKVTMEKDRSYKKEYYSKNKSEQFPVQVAQRLFVVKGFNDSIYKQIIESKLLEKGKYLYSDLGYYFIQKIIEKQAAMPMDKYVQDIYSKIGITLTYRPLNYFSRSQIAPTENDEKFRRQILQGYVHDPGAALMGGVAGHAGLFGHAEDVAKLMQLFLNKGTWNGKQIIDSNVVKEFTTCRFCPGNRRGLCFEKPEPDGKKDSPVVNDCSLESFGHSGFTGTFAWADPKNNLIVVFLSNRVYPDAEDNKLTKLGIRGKIHKAFYEALK